jgi:thiol-disulfide isomerase/thioredoxin
LIFSLALLSLPAQGQTPAASVKMVPVVAKTAAGAPVTARLNLVPTKLSQEFNRTLGLPYFPSSIKLGAGRPLGVSKEPAYVGTPFYGLLRLGNGPRSLVAVAIDEKGTESRIFLDANANGDLTDDGSSEWTRSEKDGVVSLQREATLRASWGDTGEETESGDYSLLLYRRLGDPRLNFTRTAARAGKITVGDKTFDAILADNQSDAVYTVPRKGDRTRKPVWLLLDEKGDGKYARFDLSGPVQIGDALYDVYPSISGAELNVVPSGAKPAPPAPPRILKKAGEAAPDFTVATPEGRPLKLSDFRGKTVILDFWATWCGPCQASMPGLEKIYASVKDQNVVVLSVNVWDAKAPFDAWIKANSGTKYSFTFAYDAAERDHTKSVASVGYGVSGIPTMFIIDKTGKIADAIIGSGNEGKIVDALGRLGVKAKT